MGGTCQHGVGAEIDVGPHNAPWEEKRRDIAYRQKCVPGGLEGERGKTGLLF